MPNVTRRTFLKAEAAALAAPACWPLVGGELFPGQAAPPAPRVEPDPYADARFVDGAPPLPARGAFSVIVLPDTQHYSEQFPEQFQAQTKWIVEQRQARNIACVLHLGDITNRSTAVEWTRAAAALGALDGQVPYFMTLGNHDYSDGGACTDRTTRFNEYFPLAKYRTRREFGGVYDKEPERFENSYHLFSAAGRDFLVLALEFGPRKDVVRWANEVVARHRRRAVILITHAFVYYDDSRYDWAALGTKQSWNPHSYGIAKATADDVSDGEELWRSLVSRHDNFVLTLNGHVLNDGLGRLVTATPAKREIPQLLVNFQMKPKGGDGWLRVLEFKADRTTVEAYDYSPTRHQCNESPQNRFTLTIPA